MKPKKRGLCDVIFFIYALSAIFAIALSFVSSAIEKGAERMHPYEGAWYYDAELTQSAELGAPQLVDGECTFRSLLPDTLNIGDALWFKCKNAYFTASVGGEERYVLSEVPAIFGKSPGTVWISLPLDSADAGKLIEIRFRSNYTDNSAYINDMYIGSAAAAIRTSASQRLTGALTCLALIITGAALIIVYIVLRLVMKNIPIEVLYLGLFSLFISLWSFSELKVMQIITENSAGVMHNLSCLSLMLIPPPLILYFKADIDKLGKFVVPLSTGISAAVFIVSNILHFTGVLDFHQTVILPQALMVIDALLIIYANVYRGFGNPDRTKADIAAAVCMVLVTFAEIADIVIYRLTGGLNDTSFFTRFALLAFVIALGVRSFSYIIETMKKGMKADLISHLAYEDGLTGLGNRTAYNERLEASKNEPFTIFVFDVNNLKKVNDTIGHQAGDLLIKSAAELIFAVFEKAGSCYRTGGDEFICIAPGDADAENLSDEFYKQMQAFNDSGKLGFPLVVALGWDKCEGGDPALAVNNADRKMYIKKSELKQQDEFFKTG